MIDMSKISKRYFRVMLNNEDSKKITLNVEPPKVKTLIKMAQGDKENGIEWMIETVTEILNKNKEKYKVSRDMIEDLTLDELREVLESFASWLVEVRNQKN